LSKAHRPLYGGRCSFGRLTAVLTYDESLLTDYSAVTAAMLAAARAAAACVAACRHASKGPATAVQHAQARCQASATGRRRWYERVTVAESPAGGVRWFS